MIDVFIDRLLAREGGYVDHPHDRGGPTNMGITLKTLEQYRGFPSTVSDLQKMSKVEAHQIYWAKYWLKPGFYRVTDSHLIQEMLFDAAVHHGPGRAVRLLQKCIGSEVDGMLGPKTRANVENFDHIDLAALFMGARVVWIGDIIARLPTQATFARGWMRRMEEFIVRIPLA